MCQIEGAVGGRCGSFDSRGLPEIVRFPLTTQLLLPARASVGNPIRANAVVAITSLCASAPNSSREKESSLLVGILDDLATLASLPTTRTSSGEISGSSAARFSTGKTDIACRIRSSRQVLERPSKNIFTTRNESAGVH